ncbi:hypothetical protein ON010_g9513 [Phytophthora cinnamomi]|nr:hypothetical protein ON010_g9513 [Phytophthora cinnamomi]
MFFPNILSGLPATQSSTAVSLTTKNPLEASLATSGAKYNDSVDSTADVASTASESEPWWEVTLPQLTKLGTLAVFLPASIVEGNTDSDTLNIVLIASLKAFGSKAMSLEDALAYGCPSACPHVQQLPVRKGILLWDIQAGAIAVRIYREGTGALQLSQVQAFEPFISVTPTANGAGIRSRLKMDWGTNTALLQSWRLLQTVRRSEDENLAVGMATRQSSTNPSDALSYLAVDGLKHTEWDPLIVQDEGNNDTMAAGSTRTDVDNNPWWEVDLGSVKPIRSIVLYPYVGSHYDELCAPVAPTGSNGFPAWSGDLYDYSHTDTLLQLTAPFVQQFDVLLSTQPLTNTDGTGSGVSATATKTLSFSCANYTNAITWDNIFSTAQFVTVRKRGTGVLMLNEVEVVRWNPATVSRYLLLDLFGSGVKPLAVASVQVFPPSDVGPTDSTTLTVPAPIPYTIHSVSSQLASTGAGSASALLNAKDSTQCYVAGSSTFHEWVVLDFNASVEIGLVDVNVNVSNCSTANVESVAEFSVASHGSVLDGIRSDVASQALTSEGLSSTCALDATGAVVAPSSQCKTYVCGGTACQAPLSVTNAAGSSLVVSDFVDVAVLGKSELLPVDRLPFSVNEHRTLLLRDNPVIIWPFDDATKVLVSTDESETAWEGNNRATGALTVPTTTTSVDLAIDDVLEATFFSAAVAVQPAMSSFSLEFWFDISAEFIAAVEDNLPVETVTMYGNDANGDQVPFGSVGVSSKTGRFYFEMTNSADGTVCRTDLGEDAAVLPVADKWHQAVATYDPASSSISLFICVAGQLQATNCYTNTITCNMALLSLTQKILRFGAPELNADGGGFIGKLTSVAWFVGALTTTEIMDHYHDFLDGVVTDATAAHNTYTIGLSSEPLRPVTVKMNAESACYRFNLCNVSVIPTVLVFTTENWNLPQLVHVLATDDQLYEGLHTTDVFHAESSPELYQLTSSASTASVNNVTGGQQDIDEIVSAFFRDLVLYGVLQSSDERLARQNVLVDLQMQWAQQPVKEVVVAANVYSEIISISSVLVTITDLTVPGIEFSTASLSVSEDGKGNDYQVVLLSEPTQEVQVSLHIASDCYRRCVSSPVCPSHSVELANGTFVAAGDDSFLSCGDDTESMSTSDLLCNITVSPDILVFTPEDWSLPKTVRVLAVDDHLDEEDVHLTIIRSTSASLDSVYNLLVLPDIVVAIADNDNTDMEYSTKVVSLFEKSLALSTLKYPHADYYTLKLLTEPYANVTITMSNEANAACYRRCGYPFDEASCGLPRQESVSLVHLRSNSSREIHQISLSMTKITEVQRIVTYANHVDQIIQLQVSGGFGSEVQAIVFQFTAAFKTRFTSSDAIAVATSYGSTFSISTSAGTSTAALDMFATAVQVQTAINGLFPGATNAFSYRCTDAELWCRDVLSINTTYCRCTPNYSGLTSGDLYGITLSTAAQHAGATDSSYSITFVSVDTFASLVVNSTTGIVGFPRRYDPGIDIGGTNPVTAKASRTAPIFWNDSADTLATKLGQLQGLANVTVARQQLSPEGGMAWTVQFLQNYGNLPSMIATSVNLTGSGVAVGVSTVRDGEPLRGNFTVQMGGWFKKTDPRTSRVYMMNLPLKNTTALPFNATAWKLRRALFALNITELTNVTRAGVDCDVFNVCNGYTWTISYLNSPGNLPPIAVFADNTMRQAPGMTLTSTTVANGTYLGGSFTLRLELLDPNTNRTYVGTTWKLPVNVSAIGMDEALEALPFVRSNREAEYDPETKVWRGIKFDKGVRVYREGPYLDGGHTWRLEWALQDYLRFADLKITMDVSQVTQEIEPLLVPSELDLQGKPRCSAIPTALFQADPTDPLGLRGFCVYAIANETAQERFLCNYTVLDPWIVFTPENWCVPQQVQLEAVDDYLDEYTVQNGSVTFSVVTHTVFSDDYIYLALPLPDVTVKVESDDVAKVLVSESALEVSEDGVLVAQYFLQLNSEPLADVEIVVLPWLDSDNTKCYRFGLCNLTLPVSEYIFTPQNWNVPQRVVVLATDDSLDEYDIHMTGISHVSYSADPKYNTIPTIPKINVAVHDNDVSAFVVNKASVFVTEGLGAIDSYTVVLATEPFAKVTVTVTNVGTVGNYSGEHICNASILSTSTSLYFGATNWSVWQPVSLIAVDDWLDEANVHTARISHASISSDPLYTVADYTATGGDLTLYITDNDVSFVNISIQSTTNQLHVAEGSFNDSYSVFLNSEPYEYVTVTLRPAIEKIVSLADSKSVYTQPQVGTAFGSFSSSGMTLLGTDTIRSIQLVFTPLDWSLPRVVTVFAIDDGIPEAPTQYSSVLHAVSSADANYNISNSSIGVVSVSVMINDREAIPPPLPLTAIFDSSGSKVNIAFDSSVYHAASMNSCIQPRYCQVLAGLRGRLLMGGW